MDRRHFLKTTLATGALYAGSGLPLLGRMAAADGFAVVSWRILVNVMLAGGPDFRHLFPPAYDANSSSYGYKYWQARALSHGISANSTGEWQHRWYNDYDPVVDGSTHFGILKRCGWLKRRWDASKVAIVCNAVGSKSRDHAHSLMIMDRGDVTIEPQDTGGSGSPPGATSWL